MSVDFPDGWTPDDVARFIEWCQVPLRRVATPLLDSISREPSPSVVHEWTIGPSAATPEDYTRATTEPKEHR